MQLSIPLLLAVTASLLVALSLIDAVQLVAKRLRRSPSSGSVRAVMAVKIFAAVGKRLRVSAKLEGVDERLDAAGRPLKLKAQEFAAVKLGVAVVLTFLLLPTTLSLPGRLLWLGVPSSAVLGFFLPDLMLKSLTKRRATQMGKEFADTLDLVKVTISSGVTTVKALSEVGQWHNGLLADELAHATSLRQLGLTSDEILDTLDRRCPIDQVKELVVLIKRSQQYGTPLAQALSHYSEATRSAQQRAVLEKSAKAAPKIQLVVALVMVPSVMLLIVASILSSFSVSDVV